MAKNEISKRKLLIFMLAVIMMFIGASILKQLTHPEKQGLILASVIVYCTLYISFLISLLISKKNVILKILIFFIGIIYIVVFGYVFGNMFDVSYLLKLALFFLAGYSMGIGGINLGYLKEFFEDNTK